MTAILCSWPHDTVTTEITELHMSVHVIVGVSLEKRLINHISNLQVVYKPEIVVRMYKVITLFP